MNYLALSGFGHPLNRYFNHRVTCLNAPTWNRPSWSHRHAMKVAESIREPTVLIGFSAGATAAVEIGCVCRHVTHVYAHSPMFRLWEMPQPFCRFNLFRTVGDTTPTYDATDLVYWWIWASQGFERKVTIDDLEPVAPEPVRDPATWVMARKGHQFRNCLPYLPQEILR